MPKARMLNINERIASARKSDIRSLTKRVHYAGGEIAIAL